MTYAKADLKQPNLSEIVDRYVDDRYLSLVDGAWAVASGSAHDTLSGIIPLPVGDEDRQYVIDWLQKAAARTVSRDSSVHAIGVTKSAMDFATAAYPRFLTGEQSGVTTLFSADGLQIWKNYYQSTNSLYAPLNQVAVEALVLKLRKTAAPRILEIGAGTGGATFAAFRQLPSAIAGEIWYLVTDVSARLLRETSAQLLEHSHPKIVPEFERYDLNVDKVGKRVSAGKFDAILAVNVLHNAEDVPVALQRICSLLKDDGALIFSESICGVGQQVHQEFFLNLLPIPKRRQLLGSRFLSADEWRAAIQKAGLRGDIAVNRNGAELVLLAAVSTQ